MATYVIFGPHHCITVGGTIFDSDCIAVVPSQTQEEGRKLAFEIFKGHFCYTYFEDYFDFNMVSSFKRGLIPVGV